MRSKRYLKPTFFTFIINMVSIFNLIFSLWSLIYLIFAVFIFNNKYADKVLTDKKVVAFIQAFMLCVFTFISTTFGLTLLPLMHHLIDLYLARFYYLFLLLAIAGMISYFYLFILLLKEAIKVMRLKEIS